MRGKLRETFFGSMSETGDTAWFLALSVFVGVGVGAAAALLVGAIETVSHAVDAAAEWTGLGHYIWFASVPLGFLGAWWLAHRFAPEVEGDGVPEAAAGLAVRAGYLPGRSVPFKILATALTLGGGGSAGREGPVVQIGAAIGSFVSRRAHMGEDQIRSLVAAGAGAAIGASFNAPIAGMLFAMEVILGSFAVRHLSSVVVASVSAAVTARALSGEGAVLRALPYDLPDYRELFLYAVLGLLAAAAATLFLKTLDFSERNAAKIGGPHWVRPLLLGLGVATVGFFEPRLLGTGEELTASVLQLLFQGPDLWWVLILLSVLKIVTTSTTLASRSSGGAFMPSLFIGALLGAGFAELVLPHWSISDVRPGAFAVVGMAATFAAVARAPLTSILIVFEITGLEYGLVLPLMLTAGIATLVTERFNPDSVYSMALKRKGIVLTHVGEVDLLDTVSVGEVMSPVSSTVPPDMSLKELQSLLDRHRHHGLAVVDDEALVGIITITDIMKSGGPSAGLTVDQAMTKRPLTVTPATPVSGALERMAALGVGRLPVVDEMAPTKLVGMFRREDAVRSYHYALAANMGRNMDKERLRRRTDPGTRFFEFRVPPGSFADKRALREVVWPEGCTIVSIRRGTDVMIPTGGTILQDADVVTAFGTNRGRKRLVDRLNATGEEPTAEVDLPPIPGEDHPDEDG